MTLGVQLPSGCRIVNREGSNIKRPFPNTLPGLEMHELFTGLDTNTNTNNNTLPSPTDQTGPVSATATSFRGQFGVIPFTTTHRLPRHVHISPHPTNPNGPQTFITERILVLNGVGLVSLNTFQHIYIIPPQSLVIIAPGVPHTWNACPPGLELPHGRVSDGTFLMVYEYECPTGFYPTAETENLRGVGDYVRFDREEEDMERIRFPDLGVREVWEGGMLAWGRSFGEARRACRVV